MKTKMTTKWTEEKLKKTAHLSECQVIDDVDISRIRNWVKSGKKPDRKEIDGEGCFAKSILTQWERLKVEKGILMRRWDVLEADEVRWQGIISLKHCRVILKDFHGIKASGHHASGFRWNV